jgi:hypothetical protein
VLAVSRLNFSQVISLVPKKFLGLPSPRQVPTDRKIEAEMTARAMNLNVLRVGEPRLVGGPNNGSMKAPSEYKIDTTPLAAGPRGYNWFMIFNEQLRGPLLALHDRNRIITVYCDPHEYPNWLGLVDAAIEHANEKEGAITY